MEYKHRYNSKSGKSKSNGRLAPAIVVMLSILLIAAILALSPAGEYLMQKVISPLFSGIKEKKDVDIVSALKQQDNKSQTALPTAVTPQPTHRILTIEEIPFYILQMGSYLEKDAANNHAEQIRRFGAGGAVFADGPVFRVFAAAYDGEESLVKVQSQVRSDGFEATPYITEKKVLKLTLDGDKEAVEAIEKSVLMMNDVPNRLTEMCLSYDKGELTEEQIVEVIESICAGCAEYDALLEKIKGDSISAIRELIRKYSENLSTFLKEHDTMSSEMFSGELKQLQLSIIIDYILFFDQK